MKHVMLDIETLGTKPGSVILSIGAAAFDPKGDGIGATFHQAIDPASAQRIGLTIDADTVLWWMSPDLAAARGAWLQLPLRSIEVALGEFGRWLERIAPPEELAVWGNGASFDNVLLRAAYDACALAPPWSWRGDRCFRTLKTLAPDVGPHVFVDQDTLVAHDALTDAVSQAYWAQKIVRALGLSLP